MRTVAVASSYSVAVGPWLTEYCPSLPGLRYFTAYENHSDALKAATADLDDRACVLLGVHVDSLNACPKSATPALEPPPSGYDRCELRLTFLLFFPLFPPSLTAQLL
jgi:hypothetical protein